MPFGEVDRSRIQGMRKLFETAIKSQEEIAVQQMQVMREVDHRKRLAVAAEIYRQAGEIAPKNPFVANNMVKSAVAGLMSSNDERDLRAAQQYAGMKFDTSPVLQKTEKVTIPGYSEAEKRTYGVGTEGPITKVEEGTPRKLDNPLDEATKLLRMKKLAGDLTKQGLEMSGLSLADLSDYKEKYLKAYNLRNEVVSRYPEKEIQKWVAKLSEKAPDVLNRLQQAGDDNEMMQLFAMFKTNEKTKDLLSDLDMQQLSALRQYMQNSAAVKTYNSLIKGYGLEYDPETDGWSKIGAKPAPKSKSKGTFNVGPIFQD
ncbi:MAG: hypothetical protein KKB38_20490 [Gammaproteobacteria bacterium]|nr:hypothetical protein [Gammaproteobacteria bacterium]